MENWCPSSITGQPLVRGGSLGNVNSQAPLAHHARSLLLGSDQLSSLRVFLEQRDKAWGWMMCVTAAEISVRSVY